MKIIRIAAEARFIAKGEAASANVAWVKLTAPFLERNKSWHPSYDDLEPILIGPDGRGHEFEVRGLQGGRYPWTVEDWDDEGKSISVWVGPSKNPPSGHQETFLGLTMGFRVTGGNDSAIIDIVYEERWSKKPWLTKAKCFKNGPEREIHWVFDRFMHGGSVDYIRELDPGKMEAG